MAHEASPFRFALAAAVLATALLTSAAWSVDPGKRLQATRQEVYEFTSPPTVQRDGEGWVIRFASKGYCDATVAIEDANGRIVRHLASGCLGENAPAPLQQGTLSQTIAWDGKDDLGAYVRNIESCSVRVSLGLRPRFERTLYWQPAKRTVSPKGGLPVQMALAPEGVYVCDVGSGDHVRLFDHKGDYLRTVYPFPADKLKDMAELNWKPFPQDGKKFAVKWGLSQYTHLTSGELDFGTHWPSGKGEGGPAATAIAVHGRRVFLANQRINELTTDGGLGGMKLAGPECFVPVMVPGIHEWRGGIVNVPPRSAAVSPDGKWLYLAGYVWVRSWRQGGLNGVARLATDGSGKLETFLGSLEKGKSGSEAGQFDNAVGVTCDPTGRIYVADHGNNRIEIFDPAGKRLKSVPVDHPSWVRVDPDNGDIYAFSWSVPYSMHNRGVKSRLTHLGPMDNPRVIATYDLPGQGPTLDGLAYSAEIDFSTKPPTIWLCNSDREALWRPQNWDNSAVRLLVEKEGRLEVIRDFAAEIRDQVAQGRPPHHARQRLYVHPKTGVLYVGEHHQPSPVHSKSFCDMVAINPENGKTELINLPFDTEDFAFDGEGRAYLRTENKVARFDTAVWREIPFDYGEEHEKLSYLGFRSRDVLSALDMIGDKGVMFHLGGIGVSARGQVAVSVWNPEQPTPLRSDSQSVHSVNARKYTPPMFPGRARPIEVHIWDRHGQMVHQDAMPGIGLTTGVQIDNNGNLYVLAAGRPMLGKEPYVNPLACTLIKFKPGKLKVLSTGAVIPMDEKVRPQRPPDITGAVFLNSAWVEGADWIYPGVGLEGKSAGCSCESTSQPALDYFARSFVGEINRSDVVVIDSNGNTIVRVGQYGNVDDGQPLVATGGPPATRSIGGDELALVNPRFVATHTDRRLFVADIGNARIVSVKLDYHNSARVPLKE